MKEKAMREAILAQLGALRADAGVEQVACKDESVGDYYESGGKCPLVCKGHDGTHL